MGIEGVDIKLEKAYGASCVGDPGPEPEESLQRQSAAQGLRIWIGLSLTGLVV